MNGVSVHALLSLVMLGGGGSGVATVILSDGSRRTVPITEPVTLRTVIARLFARQGIYDLSPE